jgi:hypothetical protein
VIVKRSVFKALFTRGRSQERKDNLDFIVDSSPRVDQLVGRGNVNCCARNETKKGI